MDIRQLERFVVTAEHGSIGAAAGKLGLSQPALTRSIHMLEETIGAPVFDRLPRGVKLTALGTAILPYAVLIVSERARLKEAIDYFNGLSGGSISFGVSRNLLDGLAAEAVVDFRKQNRDIRISVETGLVSDLLDLLREGSIDLVLCTIGSQTVPQDFRFEILGYNMTSIVARKQHPLAMKKNVTFEDLASVDWIVMGGESELLGLRRTFELHGAVAPPFTTKCGSLSFIKSCLLKDNYVAMLDQSYISDEIKSGVIRVLVMENEGVSLASGLLYRKEEARSPALTGFIQTLRRIAITPDIIAGRIPAAALSSS